MARSISITWYLICIFTLHIELLAGASYGYQLDEPAIQRADDSKLIEGFRQRRLFDLAEIYCQKRLTDPTIDPTSQAHLTVELMKSQTAKAVIAPPGERKIAWTQIKDSAERFSKTLPNHPRKVLVQTQLALSRITRGKQIRQEIAAEMAAATANEEGLAELRAARKLLSELDLVVDGLISDMRGRSATEHDLSSEQLLTLKKNLRYQQAVCTLHQSQMFPPADRLNRVAALNSVKENLEQVERTTSKGQPLWWNTKLGQIECFRLSGNTNAALQLADSLSKLKVPDATRFLLVEQKIQLAIDAGNEQFSRQVIEEFDALPMTTAQLDLAMIEFAISLSSRSRTDEQKRKWLDFASQSARAIGIKRGAYWGRRADLALIHGVGTGDSTNRTSENPLVTTEQPKKTTGPNSIGNTELDQLVRIGEDAVRKNNFDDAIKAYSAAAQKARLLKDSYRALQLEMIVGQILEKHADPARAAQSFIKAAFKDPAAEFASSSHLRGCWNIAQTFKAQPENKQAFEEQLLEHLKLWPQKTSADQARMYLASHYQTNQKHTEAIKFYLQVSNENKQLPNALKGIRSSATRILERLKVEGKPTSSTAQEIVSALAAKSKTMDGSHLLGESISLLQTELRLLYDARGHIADLDSVNDRLKILSKSSNTSVVKTSQAIRVSTTGSEDVELAETLLEGIKTDVGALQTCEECLAAVDLHKPNSNLKKLRLKAIEHLLARNPTTNLMLKNAKVLDQLGSHNQAVKILKELETQFPRNAGIQMELARSLTKQLDGGDSQEALTKWRRIQSKLKSYSPNWFEAKFNIANLLAKSGQKTEAIKLLRLLKQVGPGWNDSKLKNEFEHLLNSLQ